MICHSRSAFPVTLELDEVEALIDWHDDAKHGAVVNEEYRLAEAHARRFDDLTERLKARRAELKAEALALSNGDQQ